MIEDFKPTDPEHLKRVRAFVGPQQVDNQIRSAIQMCWMALPEDNLSKVWKRRFAG
jgi:hypothetical protein